MNRKTFPFAYRSAAALLLACISTFAFVFTRSSASQQNAEISAPNQKTVIKAKQSAASASENREAVTLRAEKRGFPLINLRDGKRFETDFLAAANDSAAAQSFAASKPQTMTGADLTADGAQDLVVGYQSGDGGYIAFYQGSLDTLSATTPEVFEGFKEGRFPAPFLPDAKLIKLPAAPDFIGTGDFNRDGAKDIIAAQRNDTKAFLLLGDGTGEFKTSYVEFPGRVTAMQAEMIDPLDNQTDLAVAIAADEGASLLVYKGRADAFGDSPEKYRLLGAASSLAIGQLDNDYPMDILAAASGKLAIVHGAMPGEDEAGQVEVLNQDFNASAVLIGNFVWDRENRSEIGLLDANGAIRILEHGNLDKRMLGKAELKTRLRRQREEAAQEAVRKPNSQSRRRSQKRASEKWTEGDRIQVGAPINAAADSSASFFTSARMTPFGVEDLLVLDAVSRKLHVLVWNNEDLKQSNESLAFSATGDRAIVTLDVASGTPVAAMPMRLSVMNRPGIVLLNEESSEPSFALAAPAATFNVNTTLDAYDGSCTTGVNGCSFRDALDDANQTAAADSIMLPAGIYTINPALGGPDDDVNIDPADQTSGDWDVFFDTTITGADQTTTILQAGAVQPGHDRILDAIQSGPGTPDLSISGVTIRNGRCRADIPCADGGGLRYAVDQNGVLTISNSTFSDNRAEVNAANPSNNGGGIFGGPADYVFTNVTASNNIAGFATGGCANCAGEGGGAIVIGTNSSNPTSLTMTGSTFTGNQARTTTNFGGRGGALAASPNSVSITGGTFNNNTADLDGGAFRLFTATTIDNATVSGNSAKQNGGGVYSDPFNNISTPLTSTFTNLTMKGNTADSNNAQASGEITRGSGGAIYQERGTLNLNDSTIGGTGAGEANTAFNGGGVSRGFVSAQLNVGGASLLTSTTFILNINGGSIVGNLAKNDGGGVFNGEPFTFNSHASSILSISAAPIVTISNNSALNRGGGIFNAETVNPLTDVIISNNTAGSNGGGIHNEGTLGAITNPTLNNNSAAAGGGIFNSNGVLSISGGTVNGNSATGGKGGGIEHSGSSASTVSFVIIGNNTGSGIHITGEGSLDATSNTITNNTGDGITKIGTGVGSHFNSNTIHTNGELGIDLSDNGVTPNDANDTDTGPNNLQNFPVINYVGRADGVANVTLDAPSGKYRIQYYANTACDASGHGEGELFLASQDITITDGVPFNSPALNFGIKEQITAIATHDVNGDGIFDDDGNTSEFSECRLVNTPPTITPQTATREQGTLASNSTIASVEDADQPANTLTVTVNGGSSATANGVTVSNIAINAAGNVTADVKADCSATNTSFTLRVTDSKGAFNDAMLNVTVTPNTAPTVGNYPNAILVPGGSATVSPSATLADNGSIIGATATAPGFGGTFVVNPTTGDVNINNANPYGNYTVTVTFTDNCGAITTRQFTLEVVDEAPPDTTITTSPSNPSNSSSAVFSFTGTDTGGSGIASFECKFDGGNFAVCTNPQTYNGLSNGSHTFQVRAIDAAGNADPSPASFTWTIDTIAPTVTINQADGQPDPATGNGAVIHFKAVFSEPVTGFTNSDVTLSGTAGATTVVVTQIAPNNGTTYDVAVSGMTQAGTVTASIPASAAQDAAANGNTASTSTDNTVTYNPNSPPTVAVIAGGTCGGSNGTIKLLVSDGETPAGSLVLSASSSNTAVVPNSNIVFGGSGANRTVTITAITRNSIQTSIVTITVNDGQGGISTSTVNVIAGSNQPETINGTGGADLIFGDNGADTINGGGGNDMVCGGNGNDTINGGTGDDTLIGENGDDIIRGEDGNDVLIGETGTDTLTGGSGADFFSGGSGSDNFTDFNPGQGDTTDNSLAVLDGVFKAEENWAGE